MPHYPPPGQYRGNGGVFDLILTLKVAPYMGNLTRTITHIRKCVINRNYTFSEKVRNMASEKCVLVLLGKQHPGCQIPISCPILSVGTRLGFDWMISPIGGAFEFSKVQIPTLSPTLPGRGVVGHNIDKCISQS